MSRHAAKRRSGWKTLEALLDRVDLPAEAWEALARAGAFDARVPRRKALWRIGLLRPKSGTLSGGARRLCAGAPPAKTSRGKRPTLNLAAEARRRHDNRAYDDLAPRRPAAA